MARMRRAKPTITELAFFVSGVIGILTGWLADLLRLRELDPAWLGITGFLIAAYVVTRTVSIWPIGTIEEVDALGLISKIVEVLTVLFLVSLMRSARAERRKTMRTTAAPSR